MNIEIHHLSITIKRLPAKSVDELCNLLFLPCGWITTKYKESKNMKYTFKGSKESVALRLGTKDETESYNYVRLVLHGSFFDHSPAFDPFIFLAALKKISAITFKALDVCYFEPETSAVLSVDQWIKYAEEYKSYMAGDMLRKSRAIVVREGKIFDSIRIASATSKSAYGTIYVRDGMIRNEIKYRENLSAVIEKILSDPTLFIQHAVDELKRQLVITTHGSAHTREQKIAPLYSKYLAVTPNTLSLVKLKAIQQLNRTVGDAAKTISDTKRVAGYLNNYVARHPDLSDLFSVLDTATMTALSAQVSAELF
jgi:hypothetical protein